MLAIGNKTNIFTVPNIRKYSYIFQHFILRSFSKINEVKNKKYKHKKVIILTLQTFKQHASDHQIKVFYFVFCLSYTKILKSKTGSQIY